MSASRRGRAWVVGAVLIVGLAAAGLALTATSSPASAPRELGLAAVSGAVIGTIFVVVEYLLVSAGDAEAEDDRLLLQLQTTTELSGIDLAGKDLRGAYLPGKNLAVAMLDRAQLDDATLFFSDLRNSSLIQASAVACNLGGSTLAGATLDGADLRHVDLYDADLQGASLRAAVLRHADLTSTNLSAADLRGADLSEARLHNTNLCGADLTGAVLVGGSFDGVEHDADTHWPLGFDPPTSVAYVPDFVPGMALTEWLTKRQRGRR